MDIDHLLQQLSARLPELQWKMACLGGSISSHALPRGLFRYAFDYKPLACLAEIHADIKSLSEQNSLQSAYYLSQKIHQKITVLVALCNKKAKNKAGKKAAFGVRKLSTRQRWLQALEKEIEDLEQQKKALSVTLQNTERGAKPELALALKAELGALEKQLTIARESFQKSLT